jgi:8-oxo-dGTP pyrophosphatase MutT (NUDIX family)
MEELELLKELTKNLPRFEDGRIDYSNSDVAVTVTCFVKHKDSILLLKRSNRVREGKGKWCAVTGYFDEVKSIGEKAIEEVEEELGIEKSCIARIKVGEVYKLKRAGKLLVIYPVLVELEKKPEIRLDWEHTEYRWIEPKELEKFDIVLELDRVLRRVLD